MQTMLPDDFPSVVAAALALDAAFGDPDALYRRIAHPVAWMGRLVARCEHWWHTGPHTPPSNLLARGCLTVGTVLGVSVLVASALHALLQNLPGGWLIEAVAASSLLAARGLHDHVLRVAEALALGLERGRLRVAEIVGRDPDTLDEAGVARAAIESAAENFIDGFVAPLFWFVLLGLPGLAAYKAINTLDSMIGHRTTRHEYFGKCAARLDDLATWLPARLGALMIVLAAGATPGASARSALAALPRFAGRHRSINAGWPEAAMAGAMGFALAGPRQYQGARIDDPWMGDGRCTLNAGDIDGSLRLYRRAWLLSAVAAIALAGLLARL